MIKNLINILLKHRHPWRDIDFNELSEIYTTMMLRSLAISMTGIFVPIYLYRLDYSISQILSVNAMYFTSRLLVDYFAARATAKYGPKHTLVIGQMLQIVSSGMFLSISSFNWSLYLIGIVWGASSSFFNIPYHVDFSKIKHRKHGGKELSFEKLMEKVGYIIGPLAGGIVATIAGSKYIFLVSIILLILGLWPLFQTKEPVKTNQKISFNDFKVSGLKKHLPSYLGLNIENTVSGFLWPLYLSVFVLPTQSVFIKVSIISSLAMLVSMFSVHAIGKTVDKNKGRYLLRYSASLNAIIHLFRPFISLYPVAFIINLLNEGVSNGYRLPYTKGMYDLTDDFPDQRIVFITCMEIMGNILKAFFWWSMLLISQISTGRPLFIYGFFIAAISSILIMTEKYKSLDSR